MIIFKNSSLSINLFRKIRKRALNSQRAMWISLNSQKVETSMSTKIAVKQNKISIWLAWKSMTQKKQKLMKVTIPQVHWADIKYRRVSKKCTSMTNKMCRVTFQPFGKSMITTILCSLITLKQKLSYLRFLAKLMKRCQTKTISREFIKSMKTKKDLCIKKTLIILLWLLLVASRKEDCFFNETVI